MKKESNKDVMIHKMLAENMLKVDIGVLTGVYTTPHRYMPITHSPKTRKSFSSFPYIFFYLFIIINIYVNRT